MACRGRGQDGQGRAQGQEGDHAEGQRPWQRASKKEKEEKEEEEETGEKNDE